jgi:hypothetical protein
MKINSMLWTARDKKMTADTYLSLLVVQVMGPGGKGPGSKAYAATIRVLGREGRWQEAVALLKEVPQGLLSTSLTTASTPDTDIVTDVLIPVLIPILILIGGAGAWPTQRGVLWRCHRLVRQGGAVGGGAKATAGGYQVGQATAG